MTLGRGSIEPLGYLTQSHFAIPADSDPIIPESYRIAMSGAISGCLERSCRGGLGGEQEAAGYVQCTPVTRR